MANHQQQYREKISSMISWGHWFALFNILLALVLGSRYLLINDWPASLAGRIYAYCSWLGHFSFIVFAAYLLILFPITFFIRSQRLLRVIASIIATCGLTLLLIDAAVFQRFHLHLNPIVWQLVVNPEQSELTRDWQVMFIAAPIIFLIELLFATWSWQKLRSLNRRHYARPFVALFITTFFASHVMYIWADANFYRPITMQKSNLPLSYPMTARRFLEKHGLLDSEDYQRRLIQQGDPDALSIAYPLNDITLAPKAAGYNLLVITIDNLSAEDVNTAYPSLADFAQQNVNFTQHYSSGPSSENGLFGLFYGISSSYLDGILASRIPSTLLTTLANRHYQFGLFSTDGFKQPFYRQALLTDYTIPLQHRQSDAQTVMQWQNWYEQQQAGTQPWFSWIALQGAASNNSSSLTYQQNSASTDKQLTVILNELSHSSAFDKTVVVITGSHGLLLNQQKYSASQRSVLHVPLVIHWPNTPAQSIDYLTDHQDIMATLMQRLLGVITPSYDYTQGRDLFTALGRNNWVTSSDDNRLIITTPTRSIVLNNNGNYSSYDTKGNKLHDDTPELGLLLQVLTEEKRFIAN
ncbi:LPS biosynthesis-modulating metalloenzyme YejM [Rosenbergiella australiborealis]|uniref:LPS biosynthesis-modulating metalloenzyme YejM n=1 Tax=Rosenbergiella australiborealis TaxID=1544696 RepID=UPI001F4D6B2A|nr:LPS biosynthesis-modulating metalloenzyme YejM [Rosenbergiella australiborealis]